MVHLHTHSWFSFLNAASSPETLVEYAAKFGQNALALTDDWTLAGAVQHARTCETQGIRPLHGAHVVIEGVKLVLLAADREGYANLCDLLTHAHRERLKPSLSWDDLHQSSEGLFCLVDLRELLVQSQFRLAEKHLRRLSQCFPNRTFVELIHHERAGDQWLNYQLQLLASTLGLPCVATNAVRHARCRDMEIYDALVCAKHGLTIEKGHPDRPFNDAAFLCPENYFNWAGFSREAIANTDAIARECHVNLLAQEVTPPHSNLPDGVEAHNYLRQLCCSGFRKRYPEGKRAAVEQMEKELQIIGKLELDEFFLVVREVIEFARSRNIRCSGRGSAANSIVAYLLGITEVDPIQHKLLFERFLHEGRKGMPDIDVDFDTSRRDEVIRWMNQRWGEAHTAMTATVYTFRLRSAVQEIAKVLGYPEPLIDCATKFVPPVSARHVHEYRSELAEVLGDSPALDILCSWVAKLDSCPRHLSLHSGGMILSREPLRYISPIQTSANTVRQIQFSKDDIERMGLIKFDVLGLRMLAVVAEAQTLIHHVDEKSAPTFDIDKIPEGDEATYELIRSGETLGLFQIESPGQWNLLSKIQPEHFGDLVAQVALFRPGPLQGNMVHPYILRRRGVRKVTYPHPSLEPALRDTYGVILYQEQVLEVAHAFAGLSLSEADEFRKLMSKFRDAGQMETMRERFVAGAVETHKNTKHPVHPALANSVFDTVAKFVGYGFCRSHAAAFARTVYQSAYLKAHYPAQFMSGILQHQSGFYPLQTLVEEARKLGVPVLPPCLHHSETKYFLEADRNLSLAVRTPVTAISGLKAKTAVQTAADIVLERAMGPFTSLDDALERLNLPIDVWEALARSGALSSFGERREMLWKVRASVRERQGIKGKKSHSKDQLRLDMQGTPSAPQLTPLQIHELLQWDFETMNFTTGPHPISLHRPELDTLNVLAIGELKERHAGVTVRVAGSVISRQRPPTAKGMCFLILQDETAYVPTAMTPQVYEQFSRVLRAPQLIIEGRLEDSGALAGNRYRSILIERLWPMEAVCRSARYMTASGATGHPGENPRSAYVIKHAIRRGSADAQIL